MTFTPPSNTDTNIHLIIIQVALKTALRSYTAARGLITSELEPLVAPELRLIQESITEAFDVSPGRSRFTTRRRVRWDSKDIGSCKFLKFSTCFFLPLDITDLSLHSNHLFSLLQG
jgi:hypothetical protein